MNRITLPLLTVAALVVVPFQGQASAAPPSHSLTVTGQGVASYPAFDPAVQRYAATTTAATDGALTITASTSDPQGRIWIDGAPDADGTATVTGLADGDEVSVFIDDTAGRAVHSVVYLPHDFPALRTTIDEPGQQPGHVFLTPNRFAGGSDTYEAAVDHLGVPAYVRANREAASQDLKPTGRGGYQVFRDPVGGDAAGTVLLELDEEMRTVREMRTVGLTHTDAHDAILLPDGGWIIAAYERNTTPGEPARTDAVIQQVSADGQLVHEWNSADHMAPVDPADPDREAGKRATDTMNPYVDTTGGETLRPDYAHVNSFELVDGGENLLVSFRHTSSVFKIAWSEAADRTDGHAFGDVVWRLGGKHSDFTFVDDPYLGPCAQHTATQLANGNILIYDNGSPEPTNTFFPDSSMCVNPADLTGEPVGREFTRITEYALDTATDEATLVWEYTRGTPAWFAFFAGGVTRQPNGNTLISWASTRTAMATEVTAGKEVVWELEDARTHGLGSPYFSYRGVKGALPDVTDPTATLTMPPSGTTFTQGERVPVVQQCRDTGGSSLVACAAAGATNGSLDTGTTGPLTLTLTATDGAGNSTSASRTYQVLPAPPAPPSTPTDSPTSTPTSTPPVVPVTPQPSTAGPDAAVRAPGGRWVGAGDRDGRQRASTRIAKGTKTFRVRLSHDGQGAADLTVRGSAASDGFRVRYLLDGRDVTRKVRRGRLELGVDASAHEVLRVRVTRTRRVAPGAVTTVRVRVASSQEPALRDTVQARVRAARGR